MKDKKLKLKEIEGSRVLTKRVVREFEEGNQKFQEVRWFEESKPINFGSLIKPKNLDIKQIKIEVPHDRPKFTGMDFGRLFGG